jgi:hypothetical protein
MDVERHLDKLAREICDSESFTWAALGINFTKEHKEKLVDLYAQYRDLGGGWANAPKH